MEEKIRVPSDDVYTIRGLTGGEWKECLYYEKELSAKRGVDMGDIGFWEKYMQIATGMDAKKLDSMPADDYEYLLKRIIKTRRAGPNGSRESDKTRKN